MDLFSHFQKFHQSQFLWWILDIYKKKRKPRVHENVANFRSTDHVCRINFLILWTINLFCLQGLESLRFRDGVGYVNAQFNCLLDHGSMPRIKVPPSRALSSKNFECSLYIFINRIYVRHFYSLAFFFHIGEHSESPRTIGEYKERIIAPIDFLF